MAKIAFIEDDPALQKTLGDFFQRKGYAVLPAYNGEDGLALIRREHPDLVLLDLILPRLNGLEVFRVIHDDPALAATPVIVLTNMELSDAVEQAVELGAKAYLVKTDYTLGEVLEKVRAVLGPGRE